jgi:glycosyltransferase involved in cell wall biosynthesis
MPGAIKNKKIVVICHNYEPEYTLRKPDPENRFFTYGFGGNIGKNIKFFNPDYEVEVWRLDSKVDKYYEGFVQGVKFRVFKSLSLRNLLDISVRFLRALKKEVKLNDPIIIIIHTHFWLAYEILFLFRHSKIITTHHGDWSPYFRIKITKGIKRLKVKFDIFAENRLLKFADYIFTSEMNQIPYLKLANPDCKYIMWSSGVNFEFMKPLPKKEARNLLGWPRDKKYILYVGKLYKYKQAGDLVKTWQEIKKERPDVELIIIGNNPNDPWEEFHRVAENAGAALLGRVLNKDLYLYYSAADVYVLFALRDDYFGGTGIATLESLACNTPVVSYAMRNYIGNNLNEIAEVPDSVEKYKKAIIKVLDSPGLYKNMRESVFKYYSYEAVYTRVRHVFEELFESRQN